jgi:hypothetical protein
MLFVETMIKVLLTFNQPLVHWALNRANVSTSLRRWGLLTRTSNYTR